MRLLSHIWRHTLMVGRKLNFTSRCDWLISEQLRLILMPVRVGQPLPVPLNWAAMILSPLNKQVQLPLFSLLSLLSLTSPSFYHPVLPRPPPSLPSKSLHSFDSPHSSSPSICPLISSWPPVLSLSSSAPPLAVSTRCRPYLWQYNLVSFSHVFCSCQQFVSRMWKSFSPLCLHPHGSHPMFPLSPSFFLARVKKSAVWRLINDETEVGQCDGRSSRGIQRHIGQGEWLHSRLCQA